jgi:hypothetical protein
VTFTDGFYDTWLLPTPHQPAVDGPDPRPVVWPHPPGGRPYTARWNAQGGFAGWVDGWYDTWTLPEAHVPADVAVGLDTLTREGADVVAVCEVFLDGQKVDEVPILDGSTTDDATNTIMRSCDVTVAGPVPVGPLDPLAPSGATIRLWRGAIDYTGERLLRPRGAFAFEESSVDRDTPGAVHIQGYDLMQLVRDARWEQPYQLAGGNIAVRLEQALHTRLPAYLRVPVNAASTSAVTHGAVWGEERDNDPADDLRKLAQAAGMAFFFDLAGIPTLIPVPDPDTAPVVWDYSAGVEPTYLSGAKDLRGRPYNVIVVRGEPEDGEPFEVTVEDDDPWSGSFVGRGRKPYFYTSPLFSTGAAGLVQARQAGLAELNQRKGLAEVVTISAVTHPERDVHQVVKATDPELGVDARYAIDRVTTPLRRGRQVLTTRRRRL